jgi:hypothetical protein
LIKAAHIGIGDDLFIAGLFTQRRGTQRNIPIVRAGIIASMPEEPLQDKDTGLDYSAYLAEVRSIGGLSGSPVFVHVPPDRFTKESGVSPKGAAFLLGIIRQHWDLTSKESVLDFADDFDSKLNMGIAAVTPIQEVIDTVNSKELVSRRRAAELKFTQRHAPTLDSGFRQAGPGANLHQR